MYHATIYSCTYWYVRSSLEPTHLGRGAPNLSNYTTIDSFFFLLVRWILQRIEECIQIDQSSFCLINFLWSEFRSLAISPKFLIYVIKRNNHIFHLWTGISHFLYGFHWRRRGALLIDIIVVFCWLLLEIAEQFLSFFSLQSVRPARPVRSM